MADRIVISMGDYNGIGPEVVLKTLRKIQHPALTPVILGSQKVLSFYADKLDLSADLHLIQNPGEVQKDAINVFNCIDEEDIAINPGTISEEAGRCAMRAVEEGIRWCQNGEALALVTAPISKEAVNRAGYHIPGHTEFLAEKTQTRNFLMMLVSGSLRVGLVTTHVPVSDIGNHLSAEAIGHNLDIMHHSLINNFNIPAPRIAVMGLNPHAGDGGVIGREEIDIIEPAIQAANDRDINADGPFPADGFFGNRKYEQYHAILAMYHDQGLIPFKTLSFGAGVNFTAGLPFIRTSPDHGTAFDIAGQGKANPSSFDEAFSLAVTLSKNRT